MKINDIVKITFKDHARQSELISLIAYGEIKEITEDKVTLFMLKVLEPDLENNNEEMSIVRSCIIKEEILKAYDEKF